ncbi:MAG TPA: glycoside hydrolase family 3 C-terminal domain-containing protein [Clostridia bacterium]|jgi:beta-glucosidase
MKYADIISKMSLEEKASLLSGKDFWQTQDLPKYGIKSIFLADGPHGIRKQIAASDHLGLNPSYNATCFPTAAAMANSWNPELCEEMATCLGKEAVSQHVNVLLGPGINIKRNPLCGRNFEYFSEDPYLAGKMAAAFVRGIQSNGVASCIKHFAANNQETLRMISDSVVDERALREIYLEPFEIAVKEGKVKTVMSSYNKINGVYANENTKVLKDILRGEWGFEGVVVTDWGGADDRVKGLLAGNELEMPTTAGETDREIVAAVKEGKLDEKVVDEAVDRLLTLIFQTNETLEKAQGLKVDLMGHHEVARRACEDAIVLLKNENDALPLKSKEKVAIIGDFAKNPRYQGAGSSVVNPSKLENTLENIDKYDLDFVGFEQGFNRYGKRNKGLMKKAVKLAKKADTILLYLGLDEVTETEGLDRSNMLLPQNQIDLLNELKKLGKKIVVVLSCGSAIEMDFADSADALVHAYLGGQAVARAVLNVLTGKVNPSGKLAESLPYRYSDCASSNYFPGREKTSEYRESIFVGYRYYDTANVDVRYPFGFGLSYTKFQYSDLEVSDKGVKFKITNIGKYDGAEIAQLYISLENSKIFRPKKELKGFRKVFLKVGETKTVEIPFDDKTFRFFNVASNKWEVEEGDYTISIGASSKDIRLQGKLHVDGVKADGVYDKEKLPSYFACDVKNVNDSEFKTLLGRELPNPHFEFYKKKRIKVDTYTPVAMLRYAPGWTGRLFGGAIKLAINLLKAIGNKSTANVLIMGVYYNPLRALSRLGGGIISWGQLQGLIVMFNGKFFKGLSMFLKEGRKKKKLGKLKF